jgi:hypothetical protein
MKFVNSLSYGFLGCLVGIGLAASWPAHSQQENKQAPTLHEQVQNMEVELQHLHTLWNRELFSDVNPKHWAYASMTALQAQGALQGYPAGYFRGRRILTRYEFALAIDRMQQGPPIVDNRDKAMVDELAQEFHSALELLKENRTLPRERRWLGP